MATIIAWTQETWNPTTGCSRVSEGCRHCYAERLSLKFGWSKKPWTKGNEKENLVLHPERLNKPRSFKSGTKVFVNSMSDLFHPMIPDSYVAEVFSVMNDLPNITFQILTKRPERAATWPRLFYTGNIWQGASIENRKSLTRLETLKQCPAQVRFLSLEPLLEDLGPLDLSGIHWVIVGGESGPGFRPMPHVWARAIRDQCVSQGVPFFFKQSAAFRTEMGTSLEEENGSRWIWNQYPGSLTSPQRVKIAA